MFVMTFSLSMILTYWGLLMIAGVTPAERLLKLYDEKWGKNIDHVFNEILY
jgi:gamma-glutamylcysteine synthetase